MQWIKHDTNANQDAKLKRVRMKYGLEGYGLYWYCIELIAADVDQNNLTFELEHDAEIISFDTGIHVERVNEMMAYMVNVGLFESSGSAITCLKLLKRLDQSMTSNKKMREMITAAKDNHDAVMTNPDFVMQEENRIEENRNKDMSSKDDHTPDYSRVLADQVIEMFNTVKNTQHPNWVGVEARTTARMSLTKKRILDVQKRIGSKDPRPTLDWFTNFLVAMSNDQFYSGKPSGNSQGYKWSFDSLFREKNFVNAIERINDES